ncbi:MAG: DUF1559 domain-containing protein [Pirellulaceae bacterium]|nr:DUF1559 domain-containing protein [Pirellulaceae bacterium]
MRKRKGFTLVELLVVIFIVGVLIALLVPAVNMARRVALRIQCGNNIRQIGLALNSYHLTHRHFPAGAIEWRPFGNTTQRQLAWSAYLLPYLEQGNTYDQLDLTTPFDSPQNAKGAAVVIPVYLCPVALGGQKLVQGRGPIHYGGMYGERITSPNNPPKGLMIYDKPLKASDASDGLSMTIIVAEDSHFQDGQWINGRNLFDQAFPINQAPAFENDIRSDHYGGANVVLADSTVRFLSEGIDLNVLAALCTRAGNEAVTSF